MGRIVLGLIKGIVLGGAVGYGLLRLGWNAPLWIYVACAIVGALAGVVCGQPPWRANTLWTPIVKMLVGAIIGVGLGMIGRWLLPHTPLLTFAGTALTWQSGPVLVAGVGILYGLFVEIDDGGPGARSKLS